MLIECYVVQNLFQPKEWISSAVWLICFLISHILHFSINFTYRCCIASTVPKITWSGLKGKWYVTSFGRSYVWEYCGQHVCRLHNMHVVGKAVSTNKRSPGMFRSVRLDVTLEAWTLGWYPAKEKNMNSKTHYRYMSTFTTDTWSM